MNIHFIELRERLIFCIVFSTVIFSILFYFSDILYDLFSIPIKSQLPSKSHIVAIKIVSTFTVPLKLSFYTSLIVSLPYFILNLWLFVSPGLYKDEKKSILPFLTSSILLFFSGVFFAFYIICPIALNFFLTCSPSNINIMINIENYLDFMFTIILGTALSFQIPLIIKCITKFDIISKKELTEKRPYVIILAFTIGMLLTPPDVISQVLLAIPLCILFEIGLLTSK